MGNSFYREESGHKLRFDCVYSSVCGFSPSIASDNLAEHKTHNRNSHAEMDVGVAVVKIQDRHNVDREWDTK